MKKTFFILSLIPITLTILIFPYIQDDLILFVRILLYGLIGLSLAVAIAFLFLLREKFLTIQAQRKQEQARSKAALYTTYQDGFGMTHLHNLQTGIVENLSTYPGSHHNGHWEEPPQSAMLAWFALVSKSKDINKEVLQLPTTVENVPELMTILSDAQRVLIRAISNAGKTTLLQHIANTRIKNESVLVLDSQSYPDKWPEKCKVIGAGSNHQSISIALDNLIELMIKRYQEIGQGLVKEGQHPKLTIIIDEWMAIVDECPNASDVIRRLLTESRKAAFSIFIGSHSERIKSLGLDGRGDLRDGFLIVRIEMENGERKASYDYGRGERPCTLPGKYHSQPTSSDNVMEIETIEKQSVITQLSNEESRVSEMLLNGDSRSAIARELFGSAGGNQLAKVDKIIAKINS